MGNGLAYENTPTTIQWMNTPSCFLTGKPETLKGDKKDGVSPSAVDEFIVRVESAFSSGIALGIIVPYLLPTAYRKMKEAAADLSSRLYPEAPFGICAFAGTLYTNHLLNTYAFENGHSEGLYVGVALNVLSAGYELFREPILHSTNSTRRWMHDFWKGV